MRVRIVLLYRAEASGNETAKPRDIAGGVNVASDDAWAKDGEASEPYRLNRLFLEAHDRT